MKIMLGLIMIFIILGGISFVQSIKEEEKPVEPEEEQEKFTPNIAVWFKVGITEDQAKDLIESFGLTKYKLSDSVVWKGGKGKDIGGMAFIEVQQGSEQNYIQKFKASDIVETADLNILYEKDIPDEQQKRYNNIFLIIGVIIVLIFIISLFYFFVLRRRK